MDIHTIKAAWDHYLLVGCGCVFTRLGRNVTTLRQCATLHDAEYDAARQLEECSGVLKIRDPLIYDRVDLPCPEGECHCCPCPDHHTNHVTLAYRSHRLRVVDDSGVDFSVSERPCSVNVAGARPSVSVVRLPFGNVRLSLDDTEGQFAVWRYDYRSGEYLKLLDSDGRSVINLPIDRWRRLVGSASDSSSPETPIYITSSRKGSTTLRFGYWGVSDGKLIEDWDSQVLTSVNPPLLPDMNRDGRIDTNDVAACIHGREFIYWTNEDTDKGDYAGQIADGSPNANDGCVNGFLDLVNLFPLAVDLKDFADVWGNVVSYSVEAGWGETNAFGVCFADIPWCDAGAIQTNDWITVSGEHLHSAALAEVSESGIPLSANLIRRFSDSSGVMLTEARSSYGQIRIVIRYRDAEIFGYTVPISIRRVRHLYNWINVRHFSDETENRTTWCGAQPCGSGKTLVFLHGANVAEPDAETWGDTIFKRLWLTGCNVDLYNVDWRSDIGLSANYHQNASNAFEVAARLTPIVAAIPGEKTIMAHSLGNMVVSSMIQDHGLQVSKYLMCDSAVPSEAYCGPDDESIRVPQLLHPNWEAYPTNTWASNWHKHFRDVPGDDRKFLGWPARFPDVPVVAVNFYSTGDEVLELFENNRIGFLDGIGSGWVQFCWHHQEIWKGRALPGAEHVGATRWSGWGFNVDSYTMPGVLVPITSNHYTPEQAAGLDSAQIRSVPVFNPYPASITNTTSMSLLVRAAHLTQGIPALSPPTGGTAFGGDAMSRNMFNLNDVNDIPRPHGWPTRATYPGRWLHSDMKDVAFYYNYKFYEKVAEKGNLK